MNSSLALLIICACLVSGSTDAGIVNADSVEFGRKTLRQSRRAEDIAATEM
jgi:hypothetical protein